MTGWRLGFAGAPVALIKAMDKLQSQSTSNTNSIAMAAAVEALTGPQESIEAMRKIFEERRNLVVEMLNKAPGHLLPQAGRRVLRLSLDPRLHRQDHARRQADHRRRELRAGAAGGEPASPRCTDRRSAIPGHFRIGVRQCHRGAARRLHAHPAVLRRAALMPAFADRLGRVQVAASVQMTIRARELRAQGVDIVSAHHWASRTSPARAMRSRRRTQAALTGDTKYPPQDGTPALKQAIQRKFKRDSGLDYRARRDLRHQRRQAGDLQRAAWRR